MTPNTTYRRTLDKIFFERHKYSEKRYAIAKNHYNCMAINIDEQYLSPKPPHPYTPTPSVKLEGREDCPILI
ncbi:hypothetical protein [Nostoc parmelioides]|uniref:hypothetical protein n=1 Tax=Nostoc parmelioides TaxID=1521621 RepID=UPI001682C530|nr:hypothetical protein [Nostoc parmelioides]